MGHRMMMMMIQTMVILRRTTEIGIGLGVIWVIKENSIG